MDSKQSLEKGQSIDEWEVNDFLGYGKSMEAYEVKKSPNPRKRTLLIVRNDLDGSSKENVNRDMGRNIGILETFNHPNISEVFGKGTFDERIWYVREYGENTIEDLLRTQKRTDLSKIKRLMVDYFRGIEEIHQRNLIHGDPAPRNLMISPDGKGFVTDLEFTYFEEPDEIKNSLSKTREGNQRMLFNLEFSSPEQKGETDYEIGPQSDFYSLMKVYSKILAKRPLEVNERLRDIQRNIPKRLEYLINRNLKINPDHRDKNATEILKELERIKHGPIRSRLHLAMNILSDLPFLYKTALGVGTPLLLSFLIGNPFYSPDKVQESQPIAKVSNLEKEVEKPIPKDVVPEKPIIQEEYEPKPIIPKPIVPKPIIPKEIEKPKPIPKPIIQEEYEPKPIIPKPIIPKEIEKPIPKPIIPKEVEKPIPKPIVPKEIEKPKPIPKPIIPKEIEKPKPIPKPLNLEKEVEKPIIPKKTQPNNYSWRMALLTSRLNPIKTKSSGEFNLNSAGLEVGVPITNWLEFSIRGNYSNEKEHSEVPGGFTNLRSTKFDTSGSLNYVLMNNQWLKLYAGAGIGQSNITDDITGVIGMSEINETHKTKIPYWTIETGVEFKLTENIGIKTWASYIDYNQIEGQNTETAWEGGVGLNIQF